MSNAKVKIFYFRAGSMLLIVRIKMSQQFPKPYEPFGGNVNVKVDLSNYATKTNIKKIRMLIHVASFVLKLNLASLKTELDKLDIDKLKSLLNNSSNLKNKMDILDINKLVAVPADLSKLSNVVKNEVVKTTEYNAKI